ncbi:MAG: sigma 54-interacting transcriptional regulator [Pirellulaceae bacterium]
MILEGTSRATGEDFFESLVRNLAAALDVRYAFVAEFTEVASRVRTRAFWARDRIADNVEYELAGTPCHDVVRGALCHHPCGIRDTFPHDRALVELGVESYLGVPLTDVDGNVLGHLAVFDERPMPHQPQRLYIFKILAASAVAELQRLKMEKALYQSEQRFRDLFDEAPIAYVLEDTETRFVKANQAAMRLLGLKPEDVPGTVGMSLVAPDQATQERIRETFADIQQGKERSLPELELRRKEDGRPIWVQFWSRPERDGKLTRTMIIDITDRVLAEREKARLQQQSLYLQEEIKSARNFEEIIGRSPALAAVLEHVRAVAPTDASVLIQGETGTGKELIARAIHSIGRRRDKPLIKVNCAALPAGLVESELFGHEKGAFTGAIARRVGRFELADGGTIFLDEIGELPLEMQAKLLRVLQEHELDRIGGRAPIRVDVRVIAATNRDLAAAVRAREFREDLFYRLNVFPIQLPPLRQRAGDVPLLAYYFVSRFASQLGKQIVGIHPATMERLVAYPWPGNIRELENVIERAVILCRGEMLEIDPMTFQCGSAAPRRDLWDFQVREQDPPPDKDWDTLEEIERNHIRSVLEHAQWRIEGDRGAAQILGLHPNTLRSRMKKLGIVRPE